MNKVMDKDTIKNENPPLLAGAKHSYVSKRWPGGNYSIHYTQIENWLSMADYFCISMMQSLLVVSSMLCNR